MFTKGQVIVIHLKIFIKYFIIKRFVKEKTFLDDNPHTRNLKSQISMSLILIGYKVFSKISHRLTNRLLKTFKKLKFGECETRAK